MSSKYLKIFEEVKRKGHNKWGRPGCGKVYVKAIKLGKDTVIMRVETFKTIKGLELIRVEVISKYFIKKKMFEEYLMNAIVEVDGNEVKVISEYVVDEVVQKILDQMFS